MYIKNSQREDFGAAFLDEIIEWVKNNLTPEEIYDKDVLEEWALDNGFVEEE